MQSRCSDVDLTEAFPRTYGRVSRSTYPLHASAVGFVSAQMDQDQDCNHASLAGFWNLDGVSVNIATCQFNGRRGFPIWEAVEHEMLSGSLQLCRALACKPGRHISFFWPPLRMDMCSMH